jgi:hypothetical protein
MARMVNCHCLLCLTTTELICEADAPIQCKTCGSLMEQRWWERSTPRSRTQWDEKDAVVVFRKPDGSYSYPAVNTKPTPPGCERLVMRSLREVEKFERSAGVRNEAMWFDRNGRGFDDGIPTPRSTPRRDTFSE